MYVKLNALLVILVGVIVTLLSDVTIMSSEAELGSIADVIGTEQIRYCNCPLVPEKKPLGCNEIPGGRTIEKYTQYLNNV